MNTLYNAINNTSFPLQSEFVKDHELSYAFKIAAYYIKEYKVQYICIALQKANMHGRISFDVYSKAINIIQSRLNGRPSLENWVVANNADVVKALESIPNKKKFHYLNSIGKTLMRDYRSKWLSMLVNEFSIQYVFDIIEEEMSLGFSNKISSSLFSAKYTGKITEMEYLAATKYLNSDQFIDSHTKASV